jgi:two-component system chemotaxis response regulator CheY
MTTPLVKRCLIVDDDELSCAMLSSVISKFARCDTAHNGKHALDLFQFSITGGRPYDLVCVDLAMPVMNGHALVRKIRHLEKLSGYDDHPTTIIVVSASSSPWDMAETILDGICDDYVVKPLRRDKLLDVLRKSGIVEEDYCE